MSALSTSEHVGLRGGQLALLALLGTWQTQTRPNPDVETGTVWETSVAAAATAVWCWETSRDN